MFRLGAALIWFLCMIDECVFMVPKLHNACVWANAKTNMTHECVQLPNNTVMHV